jgi:hypothetical protein
VLIALPLRFAELRAPAIEFFRNAHAAKQASSLLVVIRLAQALLLEHAETGGHQ